MRRHLKEVLTGYASRQIDLDGLEAWLVGRLQAILDSRDEVAIEITNQIDGLLIQLGEGIVEYGAIDAAVLGFLDILSTAVVVVGVAHSESSFQSATASSPVRIHSVDRGPVVDYRIRWEGLPA